MRPVLPAIMGICSIIILAAPVASASEDVDSFRFRVLLDDNEIGFHTFTITRDGGSTSVDIKADFNVRFLFINAYSYEHKNREIWKDGCLQRLQSQTDDNGKRFEVNGKMTNNEFRIVTLKEMLSLQQDCVKTFAYWDREFLNQTRLLNAQTGEYIDVNIVPTGKRSFDVSGNPVTADGYHILSEQNQLSIRVWYYEENGKWLALESMVAGGRTLRYSPVEMERSLSRTPASDEASAG